MENDVTSNPRLILDSILENYKPVPPGVKPDITITTSEIWEKVNGVVPGCFTKAGVAIILKEKGFTLVDETESFNPEWGFWVVK